MTRPASIWCPSPNFKTSKGRQVTCIVLHATATSGLSSPKEWLCDPRSLVSAHYLISREGELYHLVHEQNIAYHAGESSWGGKDNVNHFSIGIELVNSNDGIMDYPEAQLTACAELVKSITLDCGILVENIVGHCDVSPGRKTDPAAFPWVEFRRRLT